MNRPDRKYLIALVVISLFAITFRLLQPRPVDWSEGYASDEVKPFGGYILHETLAGLFPEQEVTTNAQPIYTIPSFTKNGNFIFITSEFGLDEFESEILLNRVEKGDHIFVAAQNFRGFLGDSLNIQVSYSFPAIAPGVTSLDSLLQVGANFTNPAVRRSESWDFPAALQEAHFVSFDSSQTTVLGTLNNGNINFIEVNIGRGSLFLHTSPFLFTNYFLRDTETYSYAYSALSYLPVRPTVWDEYYKPGRMTGASSMKYVATEPSLKWAWFIGLFGVLIFLFFGGKRIQRVIPIIRPVSNTSVEFASTIANMYLNSGTHKDILDKKITFFMDYLRTNLRVDTATLNNNTILQISQRSGISLENIQLLMTSIEQAQQAPEISDQTLKQLTGQIDNFYKHTQR